jgi:hypothetical protein
MTASIDQPGPAGHAVRPPVRLSLSPTRGRDQLDGGWWPRSRDLGVELADLVDQFPSDVGRVMRAVYSPPDWDQAPSRVTVARGWLKVGFFPRGDTHVVDVYTFDRTMIRLLVVPPDFSEEQGAEALLAAATPGNSHKAADLLDHVTDQAEVDPAALWDTADGETWWASDVEATSTPSES